jgi:hypothetical protein
MVRINKQCLQIKFAGGQFLERIETDRFPRQFSNREDKNRTIDLVDGAGQFVATGFDEVRRISPVCFRAQSQLAQRC